MAGRRTKCTPELISEICKVLAAGNYICVACEYVGIDESTFFIWMNRASEEMERIERGEEPREGEETFVNFFKSVTRARTSAEVQSVARLRKAGEEDWRADAWWLERSMPDRWGTKRQVVDITSGGERLEGPVIYLPGREEGEE